MGKTSIEWTEHSVNPIRARIRGTNDSVGHFCVKVSPGCKNCYASRLQPRFGMPVFQEQRGELEPELYLDPKVLLSVLRRRKPTTYFWCDMTDLFGEWVPDQWIAACFGVMAATPQHTHQVLTKRSRRMREWFEWSKGPTAGRFWGPALAELSALHFEKQGAGAELFDLLYSAANRAAGKSLPLPNVVLMVSAEDQQRADERIPDLLETPAAVRGVSIEPMLGAITLGRWLHTMHHPEEPPLPTLDWVIFGGESGAGARPYDLAWPEAVIAQCKAAGVAVFHKQVGANAGTLLRHLPTMPWQKLTTRSRKGGDMEEWPEALRVRQMPRRVGLRELSRVTQEFGGYDAELKR